MNTARKKLELIPCPFCGGHDIKIETAFCMSQKPVCQDCGAQLFPFTTKEGAITEWNSRVYPPEVQAAIERASPTKPCEVLQSGSRYPYHLCPNCDEVVMSDDKPWLCKSCGQRLDWSEL